MASASTTTSERGPGRMPRKNHLGVRGITYGESAMLSLCDDFLEFLRRGAISAIPAKGSAKEQRILLEYLKYDRACKMRYVNELRKERGQEPLALKHSDCEYEGQLN